MSETNADDIQQQIDALQPEARVLFAEAVLGKDAIDFMSTELGQYVIGMAQQEIKDAYAKLRTVSPWRVFKVQELQNDIWKAEQLLTWFQDLIVSGTRATQVLADE